jgi:hypothetical protein
VPAICDRIRHSNVLCQTIEIDKEAGSNKATIRSPVKIELSARFHGSNRRPCKGDVSGVAYNLPCLVRFRQSPRNTVATISPGLAFGADAWRISLLPWAWSEQSSADKQAA